MCDRASRLLSESISQLDMASHCHVTKVHSSAFVHPQLPSKWRVVPPFMADGYHLNIYSCRVFSVARPTVWNSLLDFIWDPTISTDCFRRLLKTHLFARY